MWRRLLGGLLLAHGIVCLLGAFFPFYPPVFLFYWHFAGAFAVKLVVVLVIGVIQVAYGVYLLLKKREAVKG
jgi:hypothetical protein